MFIDQGVDHVALDKTAREERQSEAHVEAGYGVTDEGMDTSKFYWTREIINTSSRPSHPERRFSPSTCLVLRVYVLRSALFFMVVIQNLMFPHLPIILIP